jgi:CubicO group peptidase (beta-lactamase class C family)
VLVKKLLVAAGTIVAIIALLAIVLSRLGLSAMDIEANMNVGTAVGAKLSCSARFISGLDYALIADDLSSYTSATRALNIAYDEQAQSVRASLFGQATTTARYRDGIGCALERGDTSSLDAVVVPRLTAVNGPWPAGEEPNLLLAGVQGRVQSVLEADNGAGLQTRALVVIHDGKLVAEAYGDGFNPGTPLLGWSMAKSLTAIMLGHLEMSGRLAVDERNLFPAWQQDARAHISIENLLHMSSGLDFDEMYVPGSDAMHMLFTARSASDVAIASAPAYPPGSHFAYSSGTTNMLARVVTERVGGTQRAVDYLTREIFEPLAIRSATLEVDPSGVFVGSSFIYASARDWARLGQVMLNRGELNGHRIVTENWVARATTPNNSGNDPRYGYHFWLNRGGTSLRWPALPPDAYGMNGNRAQTVMVFPSANAVIVRLGWTTGRYPMQENFAEILAELGASR